MSSFESILRLPQEIEGRLRELIRRNGEGTLTDLERREMNLMIEVRESMSLLRMKAEKLTNASAPASSTVGRGVRNGLPVVLVPATTSVIDPAAVRRSLQEEGF